MAVALLLLLGGLFGWKMLQIKQQQAAMSQPPPPAQVEAAVVTSERWQRSLQAIGSLRAVNGVRVANEIAGVVDAIQFESGQSVEAGDLLLTLDSETDQAALDTLQAEQRLAEQQYQRFADLVKQRAASQADFDEARANLDAAKARVHEQQAILDKKSIRAPFAGVVGLRLVDLGQFLQVGTPIVEIGMLNPIYVDFTIPERDLPLVAVGDLVEVSVAAQPDRAFSGSILALETSVNAESRTMLIRAQLGNPDLILRPGMFANVTAYQSRFDEVLTVPRTAISYNTYGDFVFVIEPGNQGGNVVRRRSVSTGAVRDGRVAIVSGVQEGEQVVAAGLLRLRNEQAVQIVSDDNADGGASD
ncbi:MAG: multidrug efflux RND transporter periplasmic adaptor subunit MexV [Wenzhouxiangellaceae bacterium]